MKTKVTISRYWHEPLIRTAITLEEIEISMDLEDFVKALKVELGGIWKVVRQSSFEKLLDEKIALILERVKEESAKVI
jgi:hypothetical protein